MKTVVISGGAGFIGSHVAKKLVQNGYEVVVLDSLTQQIHGEVPEESELFRSISAITKFIRGDVRDREAWMKAIPGADYIVHLAAETGTGQSMYEIAKYSDSNVGGTAVLLDVLSHSKSKIRKIVVASSRAIYGEGKYECTAHGIQYPGPRNLQDIQNAEFEPKCLICGASMRPLSTDENSRTAPASVYAITKQAQEQLVLLFGKMTGTPAVALRYQNVYGPGQSLKNAYTGILSIFSTAMLKNNPIEIFEDGCESRDFVYIDDVVDATIRTLICDDPLDCAINVGTGIPISVNEVAETLKLAYKSKSELRVSGRFRTGDIRHNFAEMSLAQELLNYKPGVAFKEGIRRFADWVKTQEIGEDNYQKSLSELKEKGLFS